MGKHVGQNLRHLIYVKVLLPLAIHRIPYYMVPVHNHLQRHLKETTEEKASTFTSRKYFISNKLSQKACLKHWICLWSCTCCQCYSVQKKYCGQYRNNKVNVLILKFIIKLVHKFITSIFLIQFFSLAKVI
ncbi:hypothetical protein Lalb_Chr09g0332491 [Lupinus albus]|uniref:Uncharacterized protein n=1 Tax=Lupinus albus TaxID=3870 RepID=A0A6A4Q145_LUPAL|nr:hypothetical protein Lalb_Chr09g0332491 [Lupinus albus]